MNSKTSRNHSRKTIGIKWSILGVGIILLGLGLIPGLSSKTDLTQGLDLVEKASAASSDNWSQEAHDAQRSGYTFEEPAEPWSLTWNWNGPDNHGGASQHIYNAPAEAHTVTGNNLIFVPAGSKGLYALKMTDGSIVWHVDQPAFNATPAYDPSSGVLLAGGADGALYKFAGDSGSIIDKYVAGKPLNKAVLVVNNNAYVITDSGDLHKVNISDMSKSWVFSAGSAVATPAAYSAKSQLIIYCTADLYVHAVRAADGSQQWKVKPTSHPAEDPYTFEGFWPVIAEKHGVVFVRLNLGFDAIFSGPYSGEYGGGVYPSSNAETRKLLEANDGKLENLFALDLATGAPKFVPAVGYGGVEYRPDGLASLYILSGPVPVVKVTDNGDEVAYIPFRSGQGDAPDGRWDSHMGEMVLDNTTVPGLAAGDMRFVDFPNSYISITDEQTPFTMAGNTLFHAHWGASESTRILDRSTGKGLTASKPITSMVHPAVVRRQSSCDDYDPTTHKTSCGLTLFMDGRYWDGMGFWVYWNVMDPPTPTGTGYSDGLRPRYTYASDGLIVVEGNGGDLSVFRYNSNSTYIPPVPPVTYTNHINLPMVINK
jgi:outer membrane protein assembly factor BamB